MSKKIKKKSNIKNIANSILLAALSTSAVSIHATEAPTLEQAIVQMMLNRQTYNLQETQKEPNPKVKATNEDVRLIVQYNEDEKEESAEGKEEEESQDEATRKSLKLGLTPIDTLNTLFVNIDGVKFVDFSSVYKVNTIGDNEYKIFVSSPDSGVTGIKGMSFLVGTDKATIVSTNTEENATDGFSFLRTKDAKTAIKLQFDDPDQKTASLVISPYTSVGVKDFDPESLSKVRIDSIISQKDDMLFILDNQMTDGSFTLPATATGLTQYALKALPLSTTRVTFENVQDSKLLPTAISFQDLESEESEEPKESDITTISAKFDVSGPNIVQMITKSGQDITLSSTSNVGGNNLQILNVSPYSQLSIAGDTNLMQQSSNFSVLNIAGKDVAAEKKAIDAKATADLKTAQDAYEAATPEQKEVAQQELDAKKTQIETDKQKALLAAEAGTKIVMKEMLLFPLSKTVLNVPQGQEANFTLSDTQFINFSPEKVEAVSLASFGAVAVQKGGTLLIGGNNTVVVDEEIPASILRLELDASNAKKTTEEFNLYLSGTGQVSYDDIKLAQVEIDATEYGATISASAKYKNVVLKGVASSGLKEVKGARNIAWEDNYSPKTPVTEAINRIEALKAGNVTELAVVEKDIAQVEKEMQAMSAQAQTIQTQINLFKNTAAASITAATDYSAAVKVVAPLAKQYGIYSVQGQKNNQYTLDNMSAVNGIVEKNVYTTKNLQEALDTDISAQLHAVSASSYNLYNDKGFQNYNNKVNEYTEASVEAVEIYADNIFVSPGFNQIEPLVPSAKSKKGEGGITVFTDLIPITQKTQNIYYNTIYSADAFPAIGFVSSSIIGGAPNKGLAFDEDNDLVLVEGDGTPATAGVLLETGVITGEAGEEFTEENIATTAAKFSKAFPATSGGVSFTLTEQLADKLNAILPTTAEEGAKARDLGFGPNSESPTSGKPVAVIKSYDGTAVDKTPVAFFKAEQTTNAVGQALEESDAVPADAVKSIPLTDDLPEAGINVTTEVGYVIAWNDGIKNAKDRAEARAPEVIPIAQKEVERLKLMLAALKAKQNSLTTANSLYTDKIKTLESQQKAFSEQPVLVGNKDVVFDAAPNIVAYGAEEAKTIAEFGADKYTAFQLQELNVSGEAKVHEVVGVSNLDKVEFVGARQTKNLFADEDVTDITFAGDVIFDGPSNANKSLFLTTEDVQTKINQLNTDLDSQQKQLVKAQTDKDNAAIATLTTQIAVTGADIQAYGAMKAESAANPNNLTIKGTTTFVGEYNAEAKGAIILGDGQGKDELFTSPKAADAKEAKMLTFKAPSFQINGSGVNLNFTTIAIDATTATVKGGGSDASTYEMATHVDSSGASGKFVAKNGALAFDPTVSTVSINVDSDLKAMLPADKRNIIVVENATMDDKAKVLANNDANKLVGVFTGVYTKGVDKTKGSISLKQLVVSESTAATQANIVKQLDNNQYTKENVTAVAAIQATYGKDATSFYNQNFTGVNAGEAIDSSEWGKGLNLVAKALQGSEADQVAFAKYLQRDQAETTSATTAVLVNTLQSGADGLGNRLVGVGGGDEDGKANTGIWANVFFNSGVGQKNADLTGGYNANGVSGVVGADHAFSDNVIMGAAIGFANSNIKAKEKPEENYSKINAILFSVYGHFDINKNIFSDVILSYGNNKITSNSYEALNAGKFEKVTTPSYNNNNIVAQAKFGYNVVLGGGINFKPQAGLQYLNIGALDYTRTGVDSKTRIKTKTDAQHNIAGLIGGTISADLPQGNMVFTPEAHVLAALSFGNKTSKIVNTYEDTILLTEGTLAAPKSNVNFGASLKAVRDNIEGSIGGDVLIGNKFTGYQGSLKVRVNL